MLIMNHAGNASMIRNQVHQAQANCQHPLLPFRLHRQGDADITSWDIEEAVLARQGAMNSLLSCACFLVVTLLVGLLTEPSLFNASSVNVVTVAAHILPLAVVLPAWFQSRGDIMTDGFLAFHRVLADRALSESASQREKLAQAAREQISAYAVDLREALSWSSQLLPLAAMNGMVAVVAFALGETVPIAMACSVALSMLVLLRYHECRKRPVYHITPIHIESVTYAAREQDLIQQPLAESSYAYG